MSRACCAFPAIKNRAEALFLELGQVGVGLKGGAEAAVQAVRAALSEDTLHVQKLQDLVALKIDYQNAFNTVDRVAILRELQTSFPELLPWFRWCYETPAALFCQGSLLPFLSSTGVQQGDPLGPFLFAIALRSCCARLKQTIPQALSIWYLDDGTIVGTPEQIGKAWQIIVEESARIGLSVNLEKCELFFAGLNIPTLLPQITKRPGMGFELLGSPIGPPSFCNSFVSKRVEKIEEALHSLNLLDEPQVEYLLLRSCLGVPNRFALRSAPPSFILEAAAHFDNIIEGVCCRRFGLSLSATQSIQLHLPVYLGGLGVVKATDIIEAAYLGAVIGASIVDKLLGQSLPLEKTMGAVDAFSVLRSKVSV